MPILLTVEKSEVMNGVGELESGASDVWGLILVLLKMYCKMWIPGWVYRKLRISLAKDSDISLLYNLTKLKGFFITSISFNDFKV